ncbi:MAG TPA: HAD-IB family hydrolase [Bacillota bacterium]|nr:HAD-IB family hydrolase [Bacillota bacterium]
MRLALFDFDGTITTQETLTDFLIFAKGIINWLLKIIMLSPWFAGFKLGFISREKVKEAFFQAFLHQWPAANYHQLALRYSKEKLPPLIKTSALDRIKWHQSQGDHVIIISASLEDWLQYWCEQRHLDLIAGKVEIKDGYLTGKLLLKDCYGPEKVNRIKQTIDLKKYDYIYAYGNTAGDYAMLELANEKYYRFFK